MRTGEARSVGLPEPGAKALSGLISNRLPLIGISFGNPYLLQSFPELRTYVVAYGDMPSLQQAAARALLGEIDITGKLPITLPGLYPRGTGIQLKALRGEVVNSEQSDHSRISTPEFRKLLPQLILETPEGDMAIRPAGDVILLIRTKLQNATGRTITWLQVRAAVSNRKRKTIKDRLVTIIPNNREQQLQAGEAINIRVLLEGLTKKDDLSRVKLTSSRLM